MKLKVGDEVRVKLDTKDCGRYWGRIGKVKAIQPSIRYPIRVQFGNQRFWRGFRIDELELIKSNLSEQKGEQDVRS